MIGVTITGADDAVDHGELVALSREFPFVEWGILISRSRQGTARYPAAPWIEQLHLNARRARHHGEPLALSAHLCGAVARELRIEGYEDALHNQALASFQRFQVNGYEAGLYAGLERLVQENRARFVLQCRSAESFEDCASDAIEIDGAEVLYDPSGGKGARAEWPEELRAFGVSFGIAGGIGPDNVAAAIAAAKRLGASWIDMESGVRDERDRFDLDRVRHVLQAAKDQQP